MVIRIYPTFSQAFLQVSASLCSGHLKYSMTSLAKRFLYKNSIPKKMKNIISIVFLYLIFQITVVSGVLADTVTLNCVERKYSNERSSSKDANKTMAFIFKNNKAFVRGTIMNCMQNEETIFCEKKNINEIWELTVNIKQKTISYYTHNNIKNATGTFFGLCDLN